MKKNETYSLTLEIIKMVKEYAAMNTGNKSKVVEMALREFFDRKGY